MKWKEVKDVGMDVRAREDVHQEIHNCNQARNRRGRGGWRSVPLERASQITASDDWAGGMLAARCTITAIGLEWPLLVPLVSLKERIPGTEMVYGAF